MSSAPQPEGIADEAAQLAGRRYVVYLSLFISLVLLFYILPELVQIFRLDFAANGSFTEPPFPGSGIAAIGAALREKWPEIVNPLRNSLTRFFIVTMFVGWALDRVREYRPTR